MSRRLPVYFVLDCSESMSGEPIVSVEQGIKVLHEGLMADPSAIETVCVSVIKFSQGANQVVPLTELSSFQAPSLCASGCTDMGEGLRLLKSRIEAEVKKTSAEEKGDWRPIIFIMSDGAPTDKWQDAANDLKRAKVGTIIACAAGSGADENMLKQITETVIRLNSLDSGTMKSFFKWVTDSIKLTSASVGLTGGIMLPPPPPESGILVRP